MRVYWVGLLTASPEGSKVGAIVSCLTMWAIVGYLVTKVSFVRRLQRGSLQRAERVSREKRSLSGERRRGLA